MATDDEQTLSSISNAVTVESSFEEDQLQPAMPVCIGDEETHEYSVTLEDSRVTGRDGDETTSQSGSNITSASRSSTRSHKQKLKEQIAMRQIELIKARITQSEGKTSAEKEAARLEAEALRMESSALMKEQLNKERTTTQQEELLIAEVELLQEMSNTDTSSSKASSVSGAGTRPEKKERNPDQSRSREEPFKGHKELRRQRRRVSSESTYLTSFFQD